MTVLEVLKYCNTFMMLNKKEKKNETKKEEIEALVWWLMYRLVNIYICKS